MTYRKKLIEVALPLEAINVQAAREKSIRHGHPSTLHLWWARRPLAAARAVIFASLVDDPGEHLPEGEAAIERERLFKLITELVDWDNVSGKNNSDVVERAQREIAKSIARDKGLKAPGKDGVRAFLAEHAPPLLDPFAGGGTIPLEAQRLGLKAYASDLNPVAVLINKALIEIPPRFAGQAPVNPGYRAKAQPSDHWKGATGLADDVRYYGKWMRNEAEGRIGHLYPKHKGETVIAWLWARTVTCPNPACRAEMPLVRSFWLSKRAGKQAWVEPVIEGNAVRFTVNNGKGAPRDGTVNRRGATCLVCGTPAPLEHVRAEGRAGRMGAKLMAIVTEGDRSRNYYAPDEGHEQVAAAARPEWAPETELSTHPQYMATPRYGMTKHSDLFTSRQLVALNTFADLVQEAREKAYQDALAAGLPDDQVPLAEGGRGARAYAEAVSTYLGLAVSKLADAQSSLTRWKVSMTQVIATFSRQALSMAWDFAESSVFNGAAGDYFTTLHNLARVLDNFITKTTPGAGNQVNAVESINTTDAPPLISSDPPYYDNVPYADLADFFYVWLRRTLRDTYPDLFRTLLTPKHEELVADPFRYGSRDAARRHFEEGMFSFFTHIWEKANRDFPVTLYYAFKQQESDAGDDDDDVEGGSIAAVASTGWETFLQGVMDANLQVTATWPMRTELANRMRNLGSNALASSVVLTCRPRSEGALVATRQDFLNALRREMPAALEALTTGAIPPVDLAQASIGPGMAVYSRYKAVLEPDGTPIRVRTALALINQILDEFLTEQEGDMDSDTRWAVAWFEQYGTSTQPYGLAETLSKAKNTSVSGLVEAGLLEARAGKVRLLGREELQPDWNPETDKRPTVWEATQHLILRLERSESAAADLMVQLGPLADAARDLAYRLYGVAERKGWTEEALAYNLLAASWSGLREEASKYGARVTQEGLNFGGES